jgi:hypothetical protein
MAGAAALEANRHPGSYVDPAGAVFEVDGRILRGIAPPFADFYASLLNGGPVKTMLGREIVETTTAGDTLAAYPLVLEHRRLSPVSYCYEWPPHMLKAAALLTLDICSELAKHDLVLKDAYPWNVVFEGPRPIFVDFTSVVPQDPKLLWVAYDQFCRFFLYPLTLASWRPSKISRMLLLDHINGVSDNDLVPLLPSGAWLAMPWLVSRVYLPRMVLRMVKTFGGEGSLATMSARLAPSRQARISFFGSLRRIVKSIRLPSQHSRWADYYADIESFLRPADFNLKQTAVARILEQHRPETVVDIGCNQGGYSILAAQAGARVTAFDSDEDSIALLYKLAGERNLHILPLVNDFLSPSPAAGWRALQYPAAPQRFRSDMALALALVHHLAITQRQTFERIVAGLADYADRWLLTEFVPLDDPRAREISLTQQRDLSWYTLDNYIASLRTVFSTVEPYPSHPEGRTLLLCAR